MPIPSVVRILACRRLFHLDGLAANLTLAGQRKLPISRLLDWLQLLVVAGATIGSTAVVFLHVYRGLPFPVVILLICDSGCNDLDQHQHDVSDGYIYALGGNPMAARRVGISISLMTIGLFALDGRLYSARQGVIQASSAGRGPTGHRPAAWH